MNGLLRERQGLARLLRLGAVRVTMLFAFHAIVFAACYAFAWLVRFEFAVPPEFLPMIYGSFPVVVGTQLLVGVFFSFYRNWWRYVGLADVIRLVFGLTVAVIILGVLWYAGASFGLPDRFAKPPRGVLLVDWAFSLLTLFGARAAIRVSRDHFRPAAIPTDVRRVMIIGAGDAGETLAREIGHRPQLGLKVVAFVDDQREKLGVHIRGIRVYGPISSVGMIADEVDAAEALIAIPSAGGARIREIIHHLSAADLPFKTMPGIDQLVSGKVNVTQLRPVNVEDLLRRKRIELPGDPVRKLFRGRRVLVTGAGGTIGSELAMQVAAFEPEALVLVERSEYALYEVQRRLWRDFAWIRSRMTASLLDICDTEMLEELLARENPEIVLHAAAHKHVPLGEDNPAEYVRNNALATRTLAELAEKYNAERFVLISTDKAINPSSVMGASKRAAEILLVDLAANKRMTTTVVRFGNVIGSSGSAIPLFIEQIAAGGPVTVTHPDVTRYFIRTSEAISLVLQAATLGNAGQIFTLDMGEPVKVADLARDLIRLSNHTEDEIEVVFTGLRPGEKLFEEIRLDGESMHPTVHPQIVITEAPQPDSVRVHDWLRDVPSIRTADQAVAALRTLVPEFETPPQPGSSRPRQHLRDIHMMTLPATESLMPG